MERLSRTKPGDQESFKYIPILSMHCVVTSPLSGLHAAPKPQLSPCLGWVGAWSCPGFSHSGLLWSYWAMLSQMPLSLSQLSAIAMPQPGPLWAFHFLPVNPSMPAFQLRSRWSWLTSQRVSILLQCCFQDFVQIIIKILPALLPHQYSLALFAVGL